LFAYESLGSASPLAIFTVRIQIEINSSPFIPRSPSVSSIDTKITRHIQRCARGALFVPDTFAVIGSRDLVDKALQRLVAEGKLRRLSRGLYDKPQHDDLLSTLWPSVDAVVKAIVSKNRIRTQPIGVYAENMLGLSDQVPAKVVLLT
jgi:hypothetical protein